MNSKILSRNKGEDISYIFYESRNSNLPTLVFMHGLKSDKNGSKALYLESKCKEREQSFLRFDFSGHGKSGGEYSKSYITTWVNDANDVIDNLIDREFILVGSSMGGWVSILIAKKNPKNLVGFVGIAAAPDFTEDLYNDKFNDDHRNAINNKGYIEIPSEYSDQPYIFTKDFIDDGRKNLVLGDNISINCPVRLVQGMADDDVSWQKAVKIKKLIENSSADVEIFLIEDGDHRLSKPSELEIIDSAVKSISGSDDSSVMYDFTQIYIKPK